MLWVNEECVIADITPTPSNVKELFRKRLHIIDDTPTRIVTEEEAGFRITYYSET